MKKLAIPNIPSSVAILSSCRGSHNQCPTTARVISSSKENSIQQSTRTQRTVIPSAVLELTEQYLSIARRLTVNKLLEVGPSSQHAEVLQHFLALAAQIDPVLSTNSDEWAAFREYLKHPGHVMQVIRKLPFYIRAGQAKATPCLCQNAGLAEAVQILLSLVNISAALTKATGQAQTVTKLPLLPGPCAPHLQCQADVPRYARGAGLFDVTLSNVTNRTPPLSRVHSTSLLTTQYPSSFIPKDVLGATVRNHLLKNCLKSTRRMNC